MAGALALTLTHVQKFWPDGVPTTIFPNSPGKLLEELCPLAELHQQPSFVYQNDRIGLDAIGPTCLTHFRPQEFGNRKACVILLNSRKDDQTSLTTVFGKIEPIPMLSIHLL